MIRISDPPVAVTPVRQGEPNGWCDACPGTPPSTVYKIHAKAGNLFTDRTTKLCVHHLHDLRDAINEVLD